MKKANSKSWLIAAVEEYENTPLVDEPAVEPEDDTGYVPVEEIVEDIAINEQDAATMGELEAAIESFNSEGRVCPIAAKLFVDTHQEVMARQGVVKLIPSAEAFARKPEARVVSLEGIADTARAIGRRIWQFIVSLYERLKNSTILLRARFTKSRKEGEDLTKDARSMDTDALRESLLKNAESVGNVNQALTRLLSMFTREASRNQFVSDVNKENLESAIKDISKYYADLIRAFSANTKDLMAMVLNEDVTEADFIRSYENALESFGIDKRAIRQARQNRDGVYANLPIGVNERATHFIPGSRHIRLTGNRVGEPWLTAKGVPATSRFNESNAAGSLEPEEFMDVLRVVTEVARRTGQDLENQESALSAATAQHAKLDQHSKDVADPELMLLKGRGYLSYSALFAVYTGELSKAIQGMVDAAFQWGRVIVDDRLDESDIVRKVRAKRNGENQ